MHGTPLTARPSPGRPWSLAEAITLARAEAGPDPIELGPRPHDLPLPAHGDERAVLAVCVLAAGWDPPALDRLWIEAAGRPVIVVEPTAGLGLRQLAAMVAAPWLRRRYGYDMGRDLVAELRGAGFITDWLIRFNDGPVGYRSYATARLLNQRGSGSR